MNIKKNINRIVWLILLQLGSIGCSDTNGVAIPITSNTPMPPQSIIDKNINNNSTTINYNERIKPMSPVIINDSLLDLSVEDFEKAYAQLPDDYKLEIGIGDIAFGDIFRIEIDSDTPPKWIDEISTTITKSQAEQIVYLEMNYENSYDISFKGLR